MHHGKIGYVHQLHGIEELRRGSCAQIWIAQRQKYLMADLPSRLARPACSHIAFKYIRLTSSLIPGVCNAGDFAFTLHNTTVACSDAHESHRSCQLASSRCLLRAGPSCGSNYRPCAASDAIRCLAMGAVWSSRVTVGGGGPPMELFIGVGDVCVVVCARGL